MSLASLQRETPQSAPVRPVAPRRPHFDVAEVQLERLLSLLEAIALDGLGEVRTPVVDTERREALRDSGLLLASIPNFLGGLGVGEERIAEMSKRIAAVDAPVARIFAVHHSQIAMLLRYADPIQQEYMLGRTVSDNGLWGSAVNSLDTRLHASPQPGGYLLSGEKAFCPGAPGSDYLLVSAYLPDGSTSICAAVASQQLGVGIQPESQGTQLGRVVFEGVRVSREAVLRVPAEIPLYAS